MQKKTIERLKRLYNIKPLHHIDTSVIIELVKNGDRKGICEKYFHKVGYKYRGCFSLPVIGEFFIKIMTEVDNEEDRITAMRLIQALRERRKIDIFIPLKNKVTAKDILGIEPRIKFTDALIAACAVENSADALITLDEDLIGNRRLENEFKIKISSPHELVG